MKIFILILAAVTSFALPTPSGATQDPAARGKAVASESHRRDLGFGNTKSELKMILENRKGRTSVRLMRLYILEVQDENDGDKSLVIFDEPRDIKGTALLSYAHILKDDDQWLYLPALKRVKRISSSNKSGPFMGSESAYEDITGKKTKLLYKKYEFQTGLKESDFTTNRLKRLR